MTELEQYPVGIDYSRQTRWAENNVFLSYTGHDDLNAASQLLSLLTKSWQEPYLQPMDIDFFDPENWEIGIRIEEQLLLASRFHALVQLRKKETAP